MLLKNIEYYEIEDAFNSGLLNSDELQEIADVFNGIKQPEYIYNRGYEIAVQKLIKIIYEKPKHQINYELGNKYLDLLSPDKLSDEEKLVEVEGVPRKLASDKESWYGKKCKTLYALEMYQQCLEIIEETFRNINNFHNRGDKWLRYRQACCYLGLKDYNTANEILLDLLKLFNHWCIYEKLYQIEKVNENYQEAMKNAAIAALSDREHKLRISMYEDMGDYLKSNGLMLEAEYHYKLVLLLREEEGWKENKRVEAMIVNNDINILR